MTSSLPIDQLRLIDYRPRPKLVVPETHIEKPRFPVIDAHNHLGELFGRSWDRRPLPELLDLLDEAGVQMLGDLDGGWGEEILHRHLDQFKAAAPERFQVFGGVDWSQWEVHGDGFGEWAAKRLEAQVRRGAQGLKIWKPFGLQVRDPAGRLAPIDDTRLAPIWEKASELRIPVIIHIADPVAFFDPIDQYNERIEELAAHPDWSFYGPRFPSFQALMEQFERLIASHPATTFIGAHVGCYAENLGWVSRMLTHYPNFYIDISARIGELGRQPYSARRLFLQFPDRILFATDTAPDLDIYRIYYRFLETGDEYFSYDTGEVPAQGRWRIYGLHLPDDVLEKVYYLNARRILQPDS
ncbi:MAG: amidohydrolase family protein [Chloroflexi bacterium]|nr:amidohydrolase family protein [Chloroflexota bacterium]